MAGTAASAESVPSQKREIERQNERERDSDCYPRSLSHPSDSEELSAEVKEVHGGDGVLGTLVRGIVDEPPASVFPCHITGSQVHLGYLSKCLKHTAQHTHTHTHTHTQKESSH